MADTKPLVFTYEQLRAGVELPAGRPARIVVRKAGDEHVLALQLKSIGDTPLVNHPVRIYSLDTGEQVGEGETDAAGLLRASVPKEGNYRIELADDALEPATSAAATWVTEQPISLVCAFLDAAGAPVVGESVEATAGGETLALRTDETGRIQSSAFHAPYELKLRGQRFMAHALPSSDHPPDGAAYQFVLENAPEQA